MLQYWGWGGAAGGDALRCCKYSPTKIRYCMDWTIQTDRYRHTRVLWVAMPTCFTFLTFGLPSKHLCWRILQQKYPYVCLLCLFIFIFYCLLIVILLIWKQANVVRFVFRYCVRSANKEKKHLCCSIESPAPCPPSPPPPNQCKGTIHSPTGLLWPVQVGTVGVFLFCATKTIKEVSILSNIWTKKKLYCRPLTCICTWTNSASGCGDDLY